MPLWRLREPSQWPPYYCPMIAEVEFLRMRPSFLRWLSTFASASATSSAVSPTSAADAARHVQEQLDPTVMSSRPSEEDWYWGRFVTGTEEDFYWRRLSDNWFQKDVIPSMY